LSLLFVILMHPILDHGTTQRLLLAILTFGSAGSGDYQDVREKRLGMAIVLLISGAVICGSEARSFPAHPCSHCNGHYVAVAFGYPSLGFSSYLESARTVTRNHLYTARQHLPVVGDDVVYPVQALSKNVYPGSFLQTTTGSTNRPTDLLYIQLGHAHDAWLRRHSPWFRPGFAILAALEAVCGRFVRCDHRRVV